jgi:membrane protein DedA with SNARE-associated domain
MDDFFSIVIPTAILTALVVAPLSYWLGWRQKNKRWARAIDSFRTRGLFISRRTK